MQDYVLSVRAVRNGAFVADVGPSKFLVVPPDQKAPMPAHAITQAAWYKWGLLTKRTKSYANDVESLLGPSRKREDEARRALI